MAEQVNIFIDNKPGRLNAVTAILRDHDIDIRAMTIADHRDYGVAKLLVNDPHAAQRALAEHGFAAALQSVLAVAIADRPGGLHALLEILAQHAMNVQDAYGFVAVPGQRAIWCMEVAEPAAAASLIAAAGLEVLDDSELYRP
ncbi:MAG TPA: ACT domain-containing protein [Candidatus Competibacteraceae bacterium]|nr:MAG: ACT domain-containing protein [Candidatus Competibacteraceae bacterium]HOB61531.1 ACT domain-containing protein [Candidatus Competibacteraceae bacterium]HQA25008.1 ACT domain-containing protein [Candidatus Competibacteraceae bacterium]HQD55973.1 ACT domain-containing protein [Candidatus Competibacteraceae bacterium]